MDVPGVCPIFDDDFANRIHLDVPSKRELNDLWQLDSASAGLRLELTEVRRNPRHSFELLPHMDFPAQKVNLLKLKAEDLTPTQATSCRKVRDGGVPV
ncbi:MAG: hypothetical protein M3460_04660 [Actinomycetota bacterium]|nr:hypothetical protein [Actinomycetota bacterium]